MIDRIIHDIICFLQLLIVHSRCRISVEEQNIHQSKAQRKDILIGMIKRLAFMRGIPDKTKQKKCLICLVK